MLQKKTWALKVRQTRIAIFLPSLHGGGADLVMGDAMLHARFAACAVEVWE